MKISGVTITRAKPEHAIQACDILIRSIQQVCMPYYNFDTEIEKEWLSNKTPENVKQWVTSPNNIGLVAIDTNKNVVGFILATRSGHILLNYIEPQLRGQGIGHALYCEIEQALIRHGVKTITADSTLGAQSFYESQGLECLNQKHLQSTTMTEIAMRKNL